jgi:DNA invertase Pin-like site-specific DNA recombinase
MTKTTKVALYARVSTRDKGQDTENQMMQLREYANKQGWEIVSEYVDRVTGSRSDRGQFQQMFADASTRKFDVLLFWSLDRFSREGTVETLNHLQRLVTYGVKWRSYTEQYIDSTGHFAEAITGFLAAMAKQERIRLSERVKAGLEKVRKHGSKSGLPIGRPKVEDDPKLVAKFRKLHDAGTSVRKIAAELDISTTTVQKLKEALAS